MEPVAILPRYRNLPLVKEVRCFIEGGRVLCQHPYWPPLAIAEGLEDADLPRLSNILKAVELTEADRAGAGALAERVATAFAESAAWSVDLLATRKGWFVTDMAEAERSFHWPGCPVEQQLQPAQE